MNSMKRQNDRILKDKLPRSVGAQYATGDQWRNNLSSKAQKKTAGVMSRLGFASLFCYFFFDSTTDPPVV